MTQAQAIYTPDYGHLAEIPDMPIECIEPLVTKVEYSRVPNSTIVRCALILKNGDVVIGTSENAPTEQYDKKYSKALARANVLDNLRERKFYSSMRTDVVCLC